MRCKKGSNFTIANTQSTICPYCAKPVQRKTTTRNMRKEEVKNYTITTDGQSGLEFELHLMRSFSIPPSVWSSPIPIPIIRSSGFAAATASTRSILSIIPSMTTRSSSSLPARSIPSTGRATARASSSASTPVSWPTSSRARASSSNTTSSTPTTPCLTTRSPMLSPTISTFWSRPCASSSPSSRPSPTRTTCSISSASS